MNSKLDSLSRFEKLGRRTYITSGIVGISIAALHTWTHFNELAGAELEQRFDAMGDIEVSGTVISSWDLFQGTSLLMGFFMFTLSAVNLAALRESVDGRPSPLICLLNIAMFASISVIGWKYMAELQLFGGMAGVVMQGLPLIAAIRRPRELPADAEASTDTRAGRHADQRAHRDLAMV